MGDRLLIQRYQQNNQKFISLVIDFNTLYRTSQVLIYGETNYGYQRKPDKRHYSKIRNYLLEDEMAILPSSIIVGVDSQVINKYIVEEEGIQWLDLENVQEKIFRIVDGQHRMKAIEKAMKVNPALGELVFSVIVIETTRMDRHKELNIFTDINSKNKRIRVDLALIAKYNYEIKEGKTENLGEHIAVKTAYKLKENKDEKNIWRNGINFDIHEENALGIVSVNTFVHSIKPLCNRYLKDVGFNVLKASEEEQYHMSEKASDFLSGLLLEAWTIVAEKWGGCFSPAVENDYFYDIKEYFYNRKYYIQKTLGVKVLNSILFESIRRGQLTEYNLGQFYRTIIASNVNISNWSAGDIFAGLSSESGFRLAKNYVLNKESD